MILGLTWTTHFGMELASRCFSLRHKNGWFLAQNTHAKLVIALVLTHSVADYSKAVGSLVCIATFAFLAGFASMGLPTSALKTEITELAISVFNADVGPSWGLHREAGKGGNGFECLLYGMWQCPPQPLGGWRSGPAPVQGNFETRFYVPHASHAAMKKATLVKLFKSVVKPQTNHGPRNDT
ncbi:Aste57867_24864 [Aphanomyces stellatus]|uniref:Aste57867_24864 protein n=1 Tax=Aphanomyces stellatus TaxID=120398 RepID=A0A485LTP1_9STRA|nr:hypothetical protein As57867_024786 [Aphanomyces stellatus]VFU01498.1 Aste57867_24864 [Aphanomyces stellatus]